VSADRPASNSFHGKADDFTLKDAELAQLLSELQGDAATLEKVPQGVDRLVTIFGTARSRPVPGENGYPDYVWSERLGAELRKAGYSISTGAGPGGMEAPQKGHADMDAQLDMKAGRPIGWQAGEPEREGANILLPNEQGATPFIPADHLSTFRRFLFRMEFLFRDNVRPTEHAPAPSAARHLSPKLGTPGGFGTVAELFTYLAMKSHGQASEPLLFGSHDDFFRRFNAAFTPFMNEREKPDLDHVFTDPKKLVKSMSKMEPADTHIETAQVTPRMLDDLELGLTRLDGKPKAVAFFAGMGPRSEATAHTVEGIAEALTRAGMAVRVSGSPVADEAVLRGVYRVNPKAEVQAFALADAPVSDHDGLEYTRVHDVLVLRELMNTNIRAIVTTPEGAKQIALLFTAACDIQTGKLPKLPIVVLDPDGKFADLKAELGKIMLSDERRYINPEDLELFTITDDPSVAIAALN
jgi:predicted Rossmann-fold nucleotide-binding protein